MTELQTTTAPKPESASESVPSPAARSGPTTAAAELAAESVTAALGEVAFQPPQHWTDLPEDDNDSAVGEEITDSTQSISSSILAYWTINGRTYHSDRGNTEYWGANDEPQNEVLDIQHHVFTLLMDNKLHFAPIPEDSIKNVVDIGTGTGLWAIDFGDQYPNARVIGTDLSPIQHPWVPPNVHFQIDDFTQEWTFEPESLDFVHFRWLIGAVTDWIAPFKEGYRVLRPGGWVETYDCNGFFESDDDTVPDKSALAQWGVLFREGSKKIGNNASFSIVRDGLQRKGL